MPEEKHEICEKAAIIDEMHADHKKMVERMHEGDLRFQAMDLVIKENSSILKETLEIAKCTQKRLFVDNGTKSHQTKIDRNSQILKGLLWAMGIICSTIIITIIGLTVKSVLHAQATGAIGQ